jgi:hypothetical protein
MGDALTDRVKARLETAVEQQAGAGFTYQESCLLLAAVNCLEHVCNGAVVHVVEYGSREDAEGEEAARYAHLLQERFIH